MNLGVNGHRMAGPNKSNASVHTLSLPISLVEMLGAHVATESV